MPDLERFIEAQRNVFDAALGELRAGCKQGHWMWFIFPQLAGLGLSAMSRFHGIQNMAEAEAYLAHALLGQRLAQCTDAMLDWREKRRAEDILGLIDARKFASSMTLFEAAGGGERFGKALDAFFNGERDRRSLAMLASGG
ncbi:MAG: DUF1810 domain-containing protein [Novosphingobium sp.]|nr:DUF1810 domain-containing protein [Novosphingobium sp.]